MKRICAFIISLFAVMHLYAQDIKGQVVDKDGQPTCSQFRVVDANTREPIAGAYVFDKAGKLIEVTEHIEFVVTKVECLSKADAKHEMKDKSQTSDFVMPDILPTLNFDLKEEPKNLKQTKFDEYK